MNIAALIKINLALHPHSVIYSQLNTVPRRIMSPSETYRLTATEVVSMISSGKLTVEDYAKSLLSRIRQKDPIVHAWGECTLLDMNRHCADHECSCWGVLFHSIS